MSFALKLFDLNWRMIEKSDAKRIARQTPTANITEVSDIPYIADGKRAHLLDVYYPDYALEKSVKLPVIIDIHGGGWMYGYKEINKNYNLYLASAGYTVISLNYRLVPEAYMDEQLQDVFTALQWIDNHLEEYPCDRKNIYITGDSAGGQLAAYTAVIYNNPVLEKAFSVSGGGLHFNAVCLTCPACDMDTRGVIGFYTRPMLGKGYQSKPYAPFLSFDKLLKAGEMPPCFLISSTGDIVARSSTKRAAEIIRDSGTPYKFMFWNKSVGRKLMHVFPVIDPNKDESVMTINRMMEFFDKHADGAGRSRRTDHTEYPEYTEYIDETADINLT